MEFSVAYAYFKYAAE